jgi:hypothetical protein
MDFKKMDVEAEASSQRSTENSPNLRARKKLILQCQRILFSAYRANQYADPDGFMVSLGMVLEQYPDDVIVYITDPRTGVQRGKNWPPTIAEIVTACDDRIAHLKRIERYENWGKRNSSLLEGQRPENPSYEELIAKFGPNFGLDPNFDPIVNRQ